jgi:integrase
LQRRREPHWAIISRQTTNSPGRAIGYRRLAVGGTWIARLRDATGQRHHQALGTADDVLDADGRTVLSWDQAQRAAAAWFDEQTRRLSTGVAPNGAYTVNDALADHFAFREGQGQTVANDRLKATAWITPVLGSIPLTKLAEPQVLAWLHDVATAPARIRTTKGAEQRRRTGDTPEFRRARKATANRIFTILKAALNHAYRMRLVANTDAWDRVRPFKGADSARVRFLSDHEQRRLVAAAEPDFRPLLTAALLTGIRYGDLAKLVVGAFHPGSRTLAVRMIKTQHNTNIALSDEAVTFFKRNCKSRSADDLMFHKANGEPWGTGHQTARMVAASREANIPYVSFHICRHTYASRAVMRGIPLTVVAAQLGHRSTKMVEKHYGHLAPNYIASTIRDAMTPIGLLRTNHKKAK